MNETDPVAVTTLAGTILLALRDSDASAMDKAAALKTAAFAVEQAAIAQQLAAGLHEAMQRMGRK